MPKADEKTVDQLQSSMPKLDRSTELALARTLAAYERTMMSWIRTATSLITFGFSVYKFFQLEAPGHTLRNHLIGPRQFAVMLVSIGLFSLVVATLEYRQNMRSLEVEYGQPRTSLAIVVAGLVSLLGILALVLMIFRH
jgi:putative membrane protein